MYESSPISLAYFTLRHKIKLGLISLKLLIKHASHLIVIAIFQVSSFKEKPENLIDKSPFTYIVLNRGLGVDAQQNRHELIHILPTLTQNSNIYRTNFKLYLLDEEGGLCQVLRFLNEALIGKASNIILATWNHRDLSLNHPSAVMFKFIKKRNPSCHISLLGYDTTTKNFWLAMKSFDFIDKFLVLDNPTGEGLTQLSTQNVDKKKFFSKFCSPPSPYNLSLLEAHRSTAKTHDVSFFGRVDSYRDYRKPFIEKLSEFDSSSFIRLTDVSQPLIPKEDMYHMISLSRIGVNFSQSVLGSHQLKGRVWEILLLGTLLLEQENSQIETFFTPDIHYVTFDSPDSLVDKIVFYLKRDDLREKITSSGRERALELQKSQNFLKLACGQMTPTQ